MFLSTDLPCQLGETGFVGLYLALGLQYLLRLAKSQIADLRAKISALQAELAQQKSILAQQLRAAYTLGVSRHWPSGYKRNVRENWGV